MADRTVRAIFEAKVSGAQKGMRDLAKDVDGAGRKIDTLTKDLKGLDSLKVNPKIDLAIQAAERQIKDITAKLGDLRTMTVTPEVTADIRQAERQLGDARKALRQLNAAKAEMTVTADTKPAKRAVDDLADDVGDAGAEGGEEAGMNIASGILDALRTIPIAGAVIGVGVALAGGILLGIKQGLAIEAERDLFSAQTGLDEDTSARFGRAAGEAYANAWGDSVAANLDTARRAMQAGIINQDATDAEIENVIAKLQGLNDLFEFDIATSVRGVGNLMRTGLVKDANEAFDLIFEASKKLPSDDLMDTLTEYSGQFTQLGLTGAQALGALVQAAQAGARDTDQVADAFKELGVTVGAGTEAAVEALEALGLQADQIVSRVQGGGPDAAAAIDEIFDALRALEAKGIDTTTIVQGIFAGPGENLGASLFAIDIGDVSAALGGVNGAAGSAERALATMSENSATKIETARRNIELAMDGIKGALAASFGDEIDGAADWVTKNRAPLMQFFIDMFNGAINMAQGFVEFGAVTLETFASVARGLADLVNALPFGIGNEFVAELENVAGGAEDAAAAIRSDIPDAIDDVAEKFNAWALPEKMKALVHDATVVMTEDLDAFNAVVASAGGTVKINGDTLNAQEAWLAFLDGINEEDGTVTINGDTVEAEDAVGRFLLALGETDGDVSIGADPTDARNDVRGLMRYIGDQSETVDVYANTSSAETKLAAFLSRPRSMTIGVRVAGVNGSTGGLLRHDGGWIGATMPGLYAGGRVPGSDPGYDNVLWPLNIGGRTLQQPLAGGEYVVNSKAAAEWGPALEAINAGLRPTQISETTNTPVYVDKLYAQDVSEARNAAEDRARFSRLRRPS